MSKKRFERVVALILSVMMIFSNLIVGFTDNVYADSTTNFTEEDVADGTVHYTVAGGINDWNPLGKANEMQETKWPGVYSYTVKFPAYDENAEWNNRFKICKIDDYTQATGGWTGGICLGTTVSDDNQTVFRAENAVAIENAIIYFDSNTGAVVIFDDNGLEVDYKFSWVGFDTEFQYTTVSEFATCGYTWPADKIRVDEIPDIETGYNKLLLKLQGRDLEDSSLYQNGEVYYTVAGGSTPNPWMPLSSANMMTESSIYSGVYEFTIDMPAYSVDTEWLNRFKICRIDDITSGAGGWCGALCLGTNVYDDNQTTFRAECEEATKVTIKFDSNTGAVLMLDESGKEIDYKFSWVGFDSELQYTTVSEFATCGYTWPVDKVKVNEIPDIKAGYDELNYMVNRDYEVDPKIVTYHFYNAKGWENVGAWIKQNVDWSEECLPMDKCITKVDDPNEPIWPGALMEAEGGGWYKIVCAYTAPEKGSAMMFNNYVGDSIPGDTTSQADIDKLREHGVILNDVAMKEQSSNIMITKGNLNANEYWINWDGSPGSSIVFGRSDMITDYAPDSYYRAMNPIEYIELPNGTFKVSSVRSEEDIVEIPFEVGGKIVTEIADSAFAYNGYVKKVIIPDSVTTIGHQAFENCISLTDITIPDSVTYIGDAAFRGCTALENIVLPDSLTGIGVSTFKDCYTLSTVIIPEGIKSIGVLAFNNCSNLTTIALPTSVSSIGASAFVGCSGITEITIPENVKSIRSAMFGGCIGLKKVYISENTINIAETAFDGCTELTICGITGSEAEYFANEYGYKFDKDAKEALKVIALTNEDDVMVGDRITVTASAAGGQAPYTYSYLVYDHGTGKWTRAVNNSTSNIFKYKIPTRGNKEIYVDVKDATGNIVRSDKVNINVKKLKVTTEVNKTTIKVGEKITLTTTVENGIEPYTYSYIVFNKTTGEWGRIADNIESNSIEWLSKSAGTRIFYVDVKDSTGAVVRSEGIEVVAKDFTVYAEVDNANPVIGETITMTAIAEYGEEPYTYSYIVYNESNNSWFRFADNIESNTFTWTAGSAGVRYFYIDVKDANGNIKRCNELKIVTAEDTVQNATTSESLNDNLSSELKVNGSASNTAVSVGDTVEIKANAAGGEGPYTYSYVIYNAATNAWFRYAFNDSDTLNWTATSAGTRTFFVEVKDATGKVIRANGITVTVK